MTDAELQGIALQALNMAKRDIQQKRGFNFLLASYHSGVGTHRMRKIEEFIVEKLGQDWLDHGRTKDYGFGVLQLSCLVSPPDALAFVTACNMFQPTETFAQRSKEEQQALVNRGHDHHHQMVREGLLTMRDGFVVVVQTPERVCMCNQMMVGGQFEGAPEIKFLNQTEFDGRLKFFGKTKEAILKDLRGVVQ